MVTEQLTTSVGSDGSDEDSTRLWHMRLGHTGEKNLQALAKKGLLKGVKTCKLEFCEHCVIGKKIKVKFDTVIYHTEEILDYVHTDVWRPTKTISLGGMHYFVSFITNFSTHYWVSTMRYKRKVLDLFVEWKKYMTKHTGKKIKILRSENDGENTSDLFLQLCRDEGIERHFTVREAPQQNG